MSSLGVNIRNKLLNSVVIERNKVINIMILKDECISKISFAISFEFIQKRYCAVIKHNTPLNQLPIQFLNTKLSDPPHSGRIQFRFQSPKRCIIKHFKNTKLYSIALLRTEMTSDPPNYQREYLPSFGSDVIFILKVSFVFLKCLLERK